MPENTTDRSTAKCRVNRASPSPGPGYYHNPTALSNHQQTLSTSKKGSASFASGTVRFPLRHAHWGMPGPTHYTPGTGSSIYASVRTDTRHPSASFLAIGREHPFGTQQVEDTPSPGQYDLQACDSLSARLASYNTTYSNSCRPERNIQAEYKKLQAAAHSENKSISRYIIETDPLYTAMPEQLQENTLTAEERFNPQNRMKEMAKRAAGNVSPHVQYRTYLKELTKHFNVHLPSTQEFIQGEIDADLAEVPAYMQTTRRKKTAAKTANGNKHSTALVGSNFGQAAGSSTQIVRGFKGKTLTGRIAGSSTTYLKKPVTIAGAMGVLDFPDEQTQIGTNMSREKRKRLEVYEKLVADAPDSMKEMVNIPPPGQYRPAFGLATANQDTILREYKIVRDYEKLQTEEKTLHGPGEYTVQDDFIRRRSESVPALHSASERFKAGPLINETPGPGSYDILRDLSTRKSFLLNEEKKFVVA